VRRRNELDHLGTPAGGRLGCVRQVLSHLPTQPGQIDRLQVEFCLPDPGQRQHPVDHLPQVGRRVVDPLGPMPEVRGGIIDVLKQDSANPSRCRIGARKSWATA
jgi:hypothetical protein